MNLHLNSPGSLFNISFHFLTKDCKKFGLIAPGVKNYLNSFFI